MCRWRCDGVGVDEVSVLIFTNWELELSLDEELGVDLQQQYVDMGDGLLKPSSTLVAIYVICFMWMELLGASPLIYRCTMG
jgi:hypothetical protein